MLTGKTLPRAAAVLAAGLLAAPWAAGQAIVSSGESFIEARLVPGRAEPDGTRMAGLVIELAPEWKTYWRSPGVAGIPPRFDWSGSANLAAAEVLWPRPQRFETFGIEALGYTGSVVFPIRLTPADPARPMAVRLGLSVGVCRDLCVLEETELSADIAPGAPEQGAGLVAAAEASVPRPAAELGLTEATCQIQGAGTKRQFGATIAFDRPLEDARVVLEGPELVWFNDVRTAAAPDTGRLEVGAEVTLLDATAWLDRSDIRMTVLAAGFAADIQDCAAPPG